MVVSRPAWQSVKNSAPSQGLLELADLAARAATGQLREHPWVAMAGDQVAHDVPAGDAVQVCHHAGQLDRRFQQLLGAVLLPGALLDQVAAVAGVRPDDPELRVRHEARPDRAALEALRQPAGV
jgi:hypothetical protein